jgi:hypothetical protein
MANSETPDLYIELRGKQVVTYRGLLHLAHQRGLVSISTEILQMPDKGNGDTAIVRAKVSLDEGGDKDGAYKTFTGIGDANPKNVSRNIAPHAIRMAETRAKARALRDAVNIGVVSVDELIGGKVSEYSAEAEQPGQHRDPAAELAQSRDELKRTVATYLRGSEMAPGRWIVKVAESIYGEPTKIETTEQARAVQAAIRDFTTDGERMPAGVGEPR